MAFSGALRLVDLDDFIGPSTECIKPVKVLEGSESASVVRINGGESLPKAQITLNDCLACSGCITSAESVLISKQSDEEMIRVFAANKSKPLDDPSRLVLIVSISPQSAASLATRYDLAAAETTTKLAGLFKHFGADHVFDLSLAIAMSLRESARDFVDRARRSREAAPLPMLASACPGWVCYAEKAHGSHILPHIGTAKSPQQIMGSLVKHHFGRRFGKTPDQIYHVTVMPCYDKKLEASRSDFYDDIYRTRDVDCVVTSLEIEKLIQDQNIDMTRLPSVQPDFLTSNQHGESCYGSGSDGYLEFILHYAAKELYNCPAKELSVKTLRNRDFKEVTVAVDNGDPVAPLKFAVAYGFRNIQTLIQKIKRKRCDYQFVEVMACPSACLNGGGQIRARENETSKDVLAKVETLYGSLGSESEKGKLEVALGEVYDVWLGGEDSETARTLLHTRYHAIERTVNPFTVKW